jgi:glycosyltransferase involved in cell wall biosynthesis
MLPDHKMNILFINSTRTWGGGETWLLQVCEGLQRRGHRVVVACRADSDLHRRLEDSAFDFFPLKHWGDFSPRSIAKLWKLIRQYEIDVICTNMEKELRLGGIAAQLAGVPIVPSREVDVPIKSTRINRYFYRRVASDVIVNSHATLNTLLNSAPWLDRERLHVVWKGIDSSAVTRGSLPSLRDRFHFSPKDCIIGFVGRLDVQKGIPTLLEAMRIVIGSVPNARLVLAGEGNLREMIVAFTRRHALEEHIFLAGFCPDVTRFLDEIAFLVMPSYWEGFGYAAIEAMAARKAVIGTYASSLPEIIDDGKTGVLVTPRSADQLAAAIVRLASASGLRNEMGSAGAVKVRTNFSVLTMVEKTEAVFHETIRSYGARRGVGDRRRSPSTPGVLESAPAPNVQLMRQ